MNQAGQNELYAIKRELRNIINELESISNGVRNDFSGIGNEKCSASIDSVIRQYEYVLKKLNSIDTNKVTEQYKKAHGGGGAGFR